MATANPTDIANVIKLLERLRTGEMNLIPSMAGIEERKQDASTAMLQRVESVLSDHLRRMQAPLGDGGPAFPFPSVSQNQGTGETTVTQGDGGMSLRDYFIAHAPVEPQPWFRPVLGSTEPPKLPPFPELPENERRKDYAKEYWQHLMLTELADCPVLLAWVEQSRAAQKAILAWNAEAAKQTLVQWPAAWADEMLKARQP